jgi:hypothetical protein
MKSKRALLLSSLAALCLPIAGYAAVSPSSTLCADYAREQARRLLAFHYGEDSGELHIEDAAKPLPSIVNPADRRQRFDVLEVWGFVYKGQYRMRFEYYRPTPRAEDCILMGQELLEYAKP